MEINGLKLPDTFAQDVRSGRLRREQGSWELRKDESAYGEPLQTELGRVFDHLDLIQKETDELPKGFTFLSTEDAEGYTKLYGIATGEVPYFWNFTKIVCFAVAGDGAAFCFDFRENEQQPTVIWWNDSYWQRIAPNYEAFIQLFDIPAQN